MFGRKVKKLYSKGQDRLGISRNAHVTVHTTTPPPPLTSSIYSFNLISAFFRVGVYRFGKNGGAWGTENGRRINNVLLSQLRTIGVVRFQYLGGGIVLILGLGLERCPCYAADGWFQGTIPSHY